MMSLIDDNSNTDLHYGVEETGVAEVSQPLDGID